MTVDEINAALSTLPAQIARLGEQENTSYALMTRLHEDYKRARARAFFTTKASDPSLKSLKELDSALDNHPALQRVKDDELLAEIEYRGYRLQKERLENEFQAAQEIARNLRSEQRNLNDTIRQEAP